ncbi:hypothetical protein FBQ82_00705 [Anaerolineae bacterium CFX7]|nr:hypothetical protein [Anaerolineae bacterium CFX7]
MTSAKQMSGLVLAIVFAMILGVAFFSSAFANGVEPTESMQTVLARPPHQDPPPPPPPPPPDDDGGNIFQNITQLINFPFASLVEALQTAMQEILRAAMSPLQSMFESALSLWLQNPGILSDGNAALPGWDLMRDAWQFMYSIAIAFWPLTLAVVAAIAAKDAVAAATWGLGDLKTALGTWFAAVLLSATSLWWMDLANNLSNAITSYVLYNFAGSQFFPGTFMVFFTVILPGLFLAFPLAGIILIIFLLILAITIFIALTFAIIARLVLMYLLVALGPLAIILGVLPPLRFVTQMWTRGLLLVLALGPIDALLLKLAFNVAQYASSAPPLQAVAAFIGVFGLLSILITINFTLVKTVFGAVIAVANQTMRAVQAVGQMVVAGALLMSGAGAGVALGGTAASGATSAGGGGGIGGSGGALGGASANGSGAKTTPSSFASATNTNGAGNGNNNPPWRPSGRGVAAAGNYLQSTRGALAGFGALLRAAGIEQMQQERAGMGAPQVNELPHNDFGNDRDDVKSERGTTPNPNDAAPTTSGQSGSNTHTRASGQAVSDGKTPQGIPTRADVTREESNVRAKVHASRAQKSSTQVAGSSPDKTRESRGGVSATAGTSATPTIPPNPQSGSSPSGANRTQTNTPPRRTNIEAIQDSRVAMGFDSGAKVSRESGSSRATTTTESAMSDSARETASGDTSIQTPSAQPIENTDASDKAQESIGNSRAESMSGERDVEASEESATTSANDSIESNNSDNGFSATPTYSLAPEAERMLSMLPENSDEAREQAAQLIGHYPNAEAQAQTALALEQAMQTVHEQNGVDWSQMGAAMERGLWSTNEAANNHIPLNDMARQMEPFTGSRNPSDFLAWQIAGHGEQFQMPSQQVAYLPSAGPYEYQAGRYIEQQLGQAIGYQDAAKMFYVIRDPSTPGGGWNKAQQFIGEVNRISTARTNEPLLELDRWMQANAPTRARVLWNMHMKIVDGK